MEERPAETGFRGARSGGDLVAAAVIGVMVLVALAAAPLAATPLPHLPRHLAGFAAAMIVVNFLVAAVLFSRAAAGGDGAAARLGAAYLFVALILVPLAMSFPDVSFPDLPGSGAAAVPAGAASLWLAWHGGFGLYVLWHACRAGRIDRPAVGPAVAGAVVVCVVGLLAAASVWVGPLVPIALFDGATGFVIGGGAGVAAIMTILGLALVRVARMRVRAGERRWLAVALMAGAFDVCMTFAGGGMFTLGWYLAKGGSLLGAVVVLVALLHETIAQQNRVAADNLVLSELAHRDGLTGLCNRRRFDEQIDAAWRQAARDQGPVSLLMIDVDHFKLFNDRQGHPAGDACLSRIAAMLEAVARRPRDVAARYGGEEFVMLLPATDMAGAAEMARLVQVAMEVLAMPHGGSPFGRVTLSIGVATQVPVAGSRSASLVAEADGQLYRAKRGGRDRACWVVQHVGPDEPASGTAGAGAMALHVHDFQPVA